MPDPVLDSIIKKIPQSQWDVNTKYLVLIGYYDYDVSWVRSLKLPHVIYFKDMPDRAPYTAVNKAKGETNILRFIIDFYDRLPKNIINVHQYNYKWYHKGNLVDILNRIYKLELKYQNSFSEGFVSINNRAIAIQHALGNNGSMMKSSGFWDNTMAPWFGTIEDCQNFLEGKSGCSQFIVSRERIHSLPLVFYQNMYDWLRLKTLEEAPTSFNTKNFRRLHSPTFCDHLSNHNTSRYMEWTWELYLRSIKGTKWID